MSAPAVNANGEQSKSHVLEVLFRAKDGDRSALFTISSSETHIHLSVALDGQGMQTIVAKPLGNVELPSESRGEWVTLNFEGGRLIVRPKSPEDTIAYFDGRAMQIVSQLDVGDYFLIIGRNGLPVGIIGKDNMPMRPMQRQILAIEAVRQALRLPGRSNNDVLEELFEAAEDVVTAARVALASGLLEDAIMGAADRTRRPDDDAAD